MLQKLFSAYLLRKPKRTLRAIYRRFRSKEKVLTPDAKEKIETHLAKLQAAILEKNRTLSRKLARNMEEQAHQLMPKTIWEKGVGFVSSIAFALLVAVVIRQVWFELYVIPSGSMRPTLKESDLLLVTKTNFGLNIPLSLGHFYFDPQKVQRGSIITFTGEGMDIPDVDTTYFYLFPGKKQFVKRLIGKPGDRLYFYGGKIYGIDAQGHELHELRNSPWAEPLEHIPFIRFDGKTEVSTSHHFPSALFYQMNQPIARLGLQPTGQMLVEGVADLHELWGFQNFAMARLLTREEVKLLHPGSLQGLGEGLLYLELTHHPSLSKSHPIRDERGRVRPGLSTSISILPLQKQHLERILDKMVTCRFQVKDGVAARIGTPLTQATYRPYLPHLPSIPDGTYEFVNGKAYRVYFGGVTRELPSDHPLFRKDPKQIQLLYNLGIEFFTQYSPSKQGSFLPSRYAYFRNQDLYLLSTPILLKEDPSLLSFVEKETHKRTPFTDLGPPLTKEGAIDIPFLQKYGLKVPEKMYLVLGDNHAMSADSREFGFVPQDNLRGKATLLFWPPDGRWGRPEQPSHSPLTFPNLTVWTTAALLTLAYSLYQRKRWQSLLSPR